METHAHARLEPEDVLGERKGESPSHEHKRNSDNNDEEGGSFVGVEAMDDLNDGEDDRRGVSALPEAPR